MSKKGGVFHLWAWDSWPKSTLRVKFDKGLSADYSLLVASSSDILHAALDAIMQERSVSRSQARRYLAELVDHHKRIRVAGERMTSHAIKLRQPNPQHRELEPDFTQH